MDRQSSTVENYLKQLYLEQNASGSPRVQMGRLATAMGVVPGTATSMVKALADAKLVAYERRGGVELTAEGERAALRVLRRHRLIELFLVNVLGLNWSEVHDEADHLEHAISDRVMERLDVLLGRPKVDPHGDPIPTPSGQVHEPLRMSLANCPVGIPLRIARVLDQESEFLQFVERQGLKPGAAVTVEAREPAAQAVRLRVPRRRNESSLGLTAAAKILVEPRRGR